MTSALQQLLACLSQFSTIDLDVGTCAMQWQGRLNQLKRTSRAARWPYGSDRQELAKGNDICAGALNVYLHCTFRGGQPKKPELGHSGAGLLGSPALPLKCVARWTHSFNFYSRKAPVSVQWFTGAETNLATLNPS